MGELIRVLQVFGIMNRGGAENMIMNLYRSIDRTKIQFDFVVHKSQRGSFDDEIESLGGKIYKCPEFNMKTYFKYKKWWNEFFIENPNYKIIHSHIRSCASIYISIAKKHGLKTIIHSHSTSNGRGVKAFVKKILQMPLRHCCDYYFGCSKEAGKWLFGKKIIKSNNFYVLNNAIDVSRFNNFAKREEVRKSLNIKNSDLVIGTVGRINTPKNPDFIIDIIKMLQKKINDFVFLWVGDGELREHIQKRIDDEELNSHIIMVGIREDVESLMAAMDLFILPSLWEGLPVVVVEAQASGLPCIISDNITREVAISDLVSYVPLSAGAEFWSDIIISMDIIRKDVSMQLIESGFDISQTSKWMMDFYRRIENE